MLQALYTNVPTLCTHVQLFVLMQPVCDGCSLTLYINISTILQTYQPLMLMQPIADALFIQVTFTYLYHLFKANLVRQIT